MHYTTGAYPTKIMGHHHQTALRRPVVSVERVAAETLSCCGLVNMASRITTQIPVLALWALHRVNLAVYTRIIYRRGEGADESPGSLAETRNLWTAVQGAWHGHLPVVAGVAVLGFS